MWCHNTAVFLFLVAMVDMAWLQFGNVNATLMVIQLMVVGGMTAYFVVEMRQDFKTSKGVVMDKDGNFVDHSY
jgi:hypothetical protein